MRSTQNRINKTIQSKIFSINCKYSGIDLLQFYYEAGEKYAKAIISDFPNVKSISILAGIGGNGADALSTSFFIHKIKPNIKIHTYLIGRVRNSHSELIPKFYKIIKNLNTQNLKLSQDAKTDYIQEADLILEALVGTGLEGKSLRRRQRDVIRKITRFNKTIISIDKAAPHYKPQKTYSLNIPKSLNSQIIKIKYPERISSLAGPGEYEMIKKPNERSHTKKNGKLLLIAESKKYLQTAKYAAENYKTDLSFYDFTKEKETALLKDIEGSDVILMSDIKNSILKKAFLIYLLDHFQKTFVFAGSSREILFEMNSSLEEKDIIIHAHKSEEISLDLQKVANQNKVDFILSGISSIITFSDGTRKIVESKIDLKQQEEVDSILSVLLTRNSKKIAIPAAAFVVGKV